MEKKYVAPEMEVYDVELESAILTGSKVEIDANGPGGEWD